MAEDLRIAAGEMPGTESGQGAGAHVGDGGRIEDGARHAGAGIEQIEQSHLGWQADLVVVDVVADDLDPGEFERPDITPQHVEVAVEGRIRRQVDARLDDRPAFSLSAQATLDGGEDLVVAERKARDVLAVKVGEGDRHPGRRAGGDRCPVRSRWSTTVLAQSAGVPRTVSRTISGASGRS